MKNIENIKQRLGLLINKYNLTKELSVDMVINWVSEENEPDAMKSNRKYQNKWMKYLETITDIDEVNQFIEVFTDIWNYFPHKSLNNKSPIEMMKN